MNTRNILKHRETYEKILNLIPHMEAYLFEWDEQEQDFVFLLAGGQELQTPSQDIVGKTLKEAFPEKWTEFELNYQKTWQGEEIEFEKKVKGRTYCFHFYPFKQAEKVIFGIALAHNISHFKRNEQLLRKINGHLIEINWEFSHRIRSKIATILGLLALYEMENQEKSFWQKVKNSFRISLHQKKRLDFFFKHIQAYVEALDNEVYHFTKRTDDLIEETETE